MIVAQRRLLELILKPWLPTTNRVLGYPSGSSKEVEQVELGMVMSQTLGASNDGNPGNLPVVVMFEGGS